MARKFTATIIDQPTDRFPVTQVLGKFDTIEQAQAAVNQHLNTWCDFTPITRGGAILMSKGTAALGSHKIDVTIR
jgi:hypothetical protein